MLGKVVFINANEPGRHRVMAKTLEKMGFQIVHLTINANYPFIRYLSSIREAVKTALRSQFVLLGHASFPLLIPLVLLLRLLRVKIIFDYPYDIITPEFFKRLRLNYLLIFILFQTSSLVLTEKARKYVGKKFRLKPSKLYFLDNLPLVDLIEKFKKQTPTVKFPSDKFIIAYSGNIFFHGSERFIPIYRVMLNHNNNIQLVIMSGPEIIRKVDEAARVMGIRDRILYVDIKPYEEFIPIINQCDMWVGLLDDESLLGKTALRTELLELMALGKPCVYAYTDAIKLHPFKDGWNIILINPHDIEGSAKKLLAYINDEEMLRAIGLNAKETVKKYFNVDEKIAELMEFIHR